MKPLQNQYQDLLEGKMSKFNFLTNIKRSLPHLVSNVTSFEDAVKILKNKRILSEVGVPNFDQKSKLEKVIQQAWAEKDINKAKQLVIDLISSSNIKSKDDILNKIQTIDDKKRLDMYLANSLLKYEKMGLQEVIASRLKPNTKYEYRGGAEVEVLEYIGTRENNPDIKVGSSMGKGHIFKWPDGKYFELGPVSVMKYISKVEDSEQDQEIINRYEREQEKHALPGGHLRESVEMPANLVADIDKVNPLEYRTGLDYELDLSGDYSAESLVKCAKKVVKNLKKNSIYYTALKSDLTQKINNKKVKSSNYEEVKKDNHVDKLNQLKSIVKKEIANTKTSLSKQEKASKATPKGVKLMKEEKEGSMELSAANVQKIIRNAGGPRANIFYTEDLEDGNVYVISKTSGAYSLVGDALTTLEKYFDVKKEEEKLDDRYRYEYFVSPKTSTADNKPQPVKKDTSDNTDDIFENNEKARQEKDFNKFSEKMIGKKSTAQNTIKDKIKSYVVNNLKKEAVKFTIGTSNEYISDREAPGFESKLRSAGVTKFNKTKIQ